MMFHESAARNSSEKDTGAKVQSQSPWKFCPFVRLRPFFIPGSPSNHGFEYTASAWSKRVMWHDNEVVKEVGRQA
jgi:hypothetical protein